MSKLLINESPLQVQPSLAMAIGLNEAIFCNNCITGYWGTSRFVRDGKSGCTTHILTGCFNSSTCHCQP